MRDWTYIQKRKFKNPPKGIVELKEFSGGWIYVDGIKRQLVRVEFDMDNLEHVNFIRAKDDNPKKPLPHLNGYCMSTGCSCRRPDGSKGRPDCGLFKCYDDDGIKKDFIYQILGI